MRNNIYERYNIIKQEKYCCVPANLQMILNRRDIKCADQKNIACELGLIVPPEMADEFKCAKVSKERPQAGYGTQIQNSTYSLSAFFKRNNYNLKFNYVYPKKKLKVSKLGFDVDVDIVVCFKFATLFGGNADWGHVALIDRIDDGIVRLVETSKKYNNYREVRFDKLLDAMIEHGESNMGGFWIIKSNNLKIKSPNKT